MFRHYLSNFKNNIIWSTIHSIDINEQIRIYSNLFSMLKYQHLVDQKNSFQFWKKMLFGRPFIPLKWMSEFLYSNPFSILKYQHLVDQINSYHTWKIMLFSRPFIPLVEWSKVVYSNLFSMLNYQHLVDQISFYQT